MLRVILGPQGYDQIVLFKCLRIGQWHELSNPKLEGNLRVRFDALLFAGLDLHCAVRGETAHLGLAMHGLRRVLRVGYVPRGCHHIEGQEPKMKEVDAAIITPPL